MHHQVQQFGDLGLEGLGNGGGVGIGHGRLVRAGKTGSPDIATLSWVARFSGQVAGETQAGSSTVFPGFASPEIAARYLRTEAVNAALAFVSMLRPHHAP